MQRSLSSLCLKAAAALAGWLALTASTSPEPLMPEQGRVLPFGQMAYFDPKLADDNQAFGRYPRLDKGSTVEPWRFRAVGNAYEFGTMSGAVWEGEAIFAFRPLPGYPRMLIGQFMQAK